MARDGAILQKIYREHYGIHASAYLLFSRFASFELIFEDYPQEYIEKNIRPRLDRRGCDNSMAGILKECGLEFLLCRLPEGGMAESDILCQDNYGQFKDWLLRYHKQITEHFHESCVAAEQYYRKVCRGHRNICVVDLGWHGKSIVYLKYFMERKCAMDVRVTGAMIGACDDVVTQNYIRKPKGRCGLWQVSYYEKYGSFDAVFRTNEPHFTFHNQPYLLQGFEPVEKICILLP